MTREEELWLALSLVEKLGPATLHHLLDRLGTVEQVAGAAPEELCRASGIAPALAERIARATEVDAFKMERRLVAEQGIGLLTFDSAAYPAPLKDIPNPPLLLYRRGQAVSWNGMALAVVGSRKTTRYGEATTRRFIAALAALAPGTLIISGLARGIDTVAHEAALDCGLPTVVLPMAWPVSIRRKMPRLPKESVPRVA